MELIAKNEGFKERPELHTHRSKLRSPRAMRNSKFLWLLECLLILPLAALSASAGDWSCDIMPYLWVANVDVQTSLSGSGSPSSEQRFDTRIKAGALLAGQVHYRDFGVFADFAWLRLDTEAVDPRPAYSAVDLKSDFIHSTAALSYRLPLEGKFQVEAMAGARVWYVANDLEATKGLLPGFAANTDKIWVDPMIGANLGYELNKRWSLGMRGFVGGFGLSADLAGEVFAGATYHFKDWCSAALGYRYLYEKYDRAIKFDLDAQGFLLGFGFHF